MRPVQENLPVLTCICRQYTRESSSLPALRHRYTDKRYVRIQRLKRGKVTKVSAHSVLQAKCHQSSQSFRKLINVGGLFPRLGDELARKEKPLDKKNNTKKCPLHKRRYEWVSRGTTGVLT
ncbi:hypothetical protein CEXT_465631 [Caerostris extrusa]|uniref:Uncharacterized protein n=1 Tax=Caerostris extrusa TaxID=172846 RepID=A0AAV4XU14_CAEEX|nr:hypothetical protein CEXT_465631 [Caerostris extrusa]